MRPLIPLPQGVPWSNHNSLPKSLDPVTLAIFGLQRENIELQKCSRVASVRLREGAKKASSFLPHVFLLRFPQHTTLLILSIIFKFNIKKIAHLTSTVLCVVEHGK